MRYTLDNDICYAVAMRNTVIETTWSVWLTQAIDWLGLILVVLLPLILGPGGATPVAKMVTVNIAGAILLTAVGLRFLERRGWRQAGWWQVSTPEIALGLLGGVLIVSTLVAPDRNLSWWGDKHHGLGALTYLLLLTSAIILGRALKQERYLTHCLWAVTLGLFIISVHALCQFIGIDLPVYQSLQSASTGWGRRAFATFGNAIHLTFYLVLVLPILVSWWLTLTHRIQRWLVGLISLAGFLAVLASITGHSGAQVFLYTAYLSLFGMLGVWLWLIRSTKPVLRRNLKWLTWLIFGGLVISGLLVRWPALLGASSGPLSHLVPQSEAFAARYPNWAMARQVADGRPWLGYGLDAYQNYYHQVYNRQLTSFNLQESHIDRAHQLTLDWLISTGWIGWLTYLLMVGLGLRAAWQ